MTTTKARKKIEFVAIYLRKSRDEEGTDALAKHRKQLIEFAEAEEWNYRLYEEIGTSQDIKYRPKFSGLLDKVEAGEFDAVVCVDFDRITRSTLKEYGQIQEIFAESETLIITPYETFDFTDETKELSNDMQAVLGRHEYIQIKKRLREGKKRSARAGHWVNGKAPIGYKYNKETKRLDIVEDQAKQVRLIFDLYIDGKSLQEIGFEMNRRGFLTSDSKYYQVNKVQRILKNHAYIGWIVYGKTEGSGHKNKKTKRLRNKDQSDWIVTEDAHPPIITKEDFDKVQSIMSRRQKVPHKARENRFTLSGLMRCNRCGSTLRFTTKKLATRGQVLYLRKCQHPEPFGERCKNSGCDSLIILDALKDELDRYKDDLTKNRKKGEDDTKRRIERTIESYEVEIDKLQGGLERIKTLFIEGLIERDEMKDRSEDHTKKLDEAKANLREVRKELNHVSSETNELKIKRIKKLQETTDIMNPFDSSLNHMLREIVDVIYYEKDDQGNINIDIRFM